MAHNPPSRAAATPLRLVASLQQAVVEAEEQVQGMQRYTGLPVWQALDLLALRWDLGEMQRQLEALHEQCWCQQLRLRRLEAEPEACG